MSGLSDRESIYRGIARDAIERNPYVRYVSGQFSDPEQATFNIAATGMNMLMDDPLVKRVSVLADEIVALPGGLDAMVKLNAELPSPDLPVIRCRADAKRAVKVFRVYLRRRITMLTVLRAKLKEDEAE
jgi:hypothetical protein